MMHYFLGVDIGNTKCHALIADASGQVIGFGHTGNGNHEVVGAEGFKRALHEVVNGALQTAKLDPAQISAAGLGIAGFDWDSDRPLMNTTIDSLGLGCPYEYVNDSVIGLLAGARRGWGVAISAGTSANAWGRDAHGKTGRLTGNGAYFGEFGGGVELVQYALQAISRAWSLRGPQTRLTDLFVQQVGAKDATDFLEGVARERYSVKSAFAPLIFQAADEGDAVAIEALHWSGRELANQGIGIIRQLGFEQMAFEVVLAGSLYNGSPVIVEVMTGEIHAVAPHAELVRLDAPPVAGGVVLAMQTIGFDFQPVRERLLTSAKHAITHTNR